MAKKSAIENNLRKQRLVKKSLRASNAQAPSWSSDGWATAVVIDA
jgi:hypothetical protein